MIKAIRVVALAAALVAACTRGDTEVAPAAATTSPQSSVPVLPDISALAPEIQQQVRNDYAAITAIEQGASRAASEAVRKMPIPITSPITIIVRSNRPSFGFVLMR